MIADSEGNIVNEVRKIEITMTEDGEVTIKTEFNAQWTRILLQDAMEILKKKIQSQAKLIMAPAPAGGDLKLRQ